MQDRYSIERDHLQSKSMMGKTFNSSTSITRSSMNWEKRAGRNNMHDMSKSNNASRMPGFPLETPDSNQTSQIRSSLSSYMQSRNNMGRKTESGGGMLTSTTSS